jgi:eukaryotic-like serine/threonine-protein kinase
VGANDDRTTQRTDPAFELLPSGKTLLQERLAIYALSLLVIASGYWVGFPFIWSAHPGVGREAISAHVFSPAALVLLGLYAGVWLLCRGRPLPRTLVIALDPVLHLLIGTTYHWILLSHPAGALAPMEGVMAVSTLLGVRALLLPSSGARTALAGVCLCLGPVLTIFGDAEHFTAPWLGTRVSGTLFIQWVLVAILLTSVASRVLYGLRREVQDARRLGQYTLVERLGEGGMGVVYRAQHALLRRPTAVKLLPQTERLDSIVRFEREVQLMAELNHPNTVAVYDYGRTAEGVFYYAMEYLDGVDLEGLVAVGGTQPAERVIHLLRQVCGSLEEAHQRALIHRDVKPANLFVCRNRSEPDLVKVLDFGLVKDLVKADRASSQESSFLGTPLYMSPEAFSAPGSLDARSDLYSLGAVAYFLLTGAPVFSGSTIEVCAKHLHATPEPLAGRGVPADIEAIVLSCLAKQPNARPSSARALREALERCGKANANAWSAQDAEVWWIGHAAAIENRRKERAGHGPSHGKTVVVDLREPRSARPWRPWR